ncbi:MAG TPA: redoxin domain-containing protein [Bacillota bacterium]|nr:redoxin domain-containing protein [Bacillota bacterium]
MRRFLSQNKAFMIILFFTIFLAACSDSETAPPFELPDLDGNMVSLEEIADSGEKVYLKFWTSWCNVCIDGLDDLEELASEEQDFTVLTIIHPGYAGEKSSLDKFLEWYEPLGYENIPILVDEDGKWTSQFEVMAYPTAVYIDEELNMSDHVLGNQTIEEIKETIDEL